MEKKRKRKSSEVNNKVKAKNENNNIKESPQKLDFKSIFVNYLKFYKQKLMRKHIIIYIICLVVFFVMVATLISKINSTPNITELIESAKKVNEQSKGIISLIFSKKIPLVFMIIFAGITPYLFLPVIGIAGAYTLAVDIATNFNVLTEKASVVPMCIGAIIQLIAIGLAIATGIQYCILNTKKWRYNRNQEYSMLDFKTRLYEATKNNKKLDKVNKKKEEKQIKNEKNNVKIPYLYLLFSFIISVIIITIGTIISKI